MNLPDLANEEDEIPVVPMLEAQDENPWKPLFGLYKDVPAYEDVIAIIQADRDALGDEEIDPGFYMPNESVAPKPAWTKFVGIFEDDADFAAIVNEMQAERESDDESEIDPAYYLET